MANSEWSVGGALATNEKVAIDEWRLATGLKKQIQPQIKFHALRITHHGLRITPYASPSSPTIPTQQ
ncbi:MAG: hypothetical protein SQA66_13140, partial [Candidatus Fervidibacter sacchari]